MTRLRVCPGRTLRRTSAAGLAAALLLAGGIATSTAQADAAAPTSSPTPVSVGPSHSADARVSRAAASCNPTVAHHELLAAMARMHRAGDAASFTGRQLRRIDRRLHRRLVSGSVSRPDARFSLLLRIPVAVHVLAGTKDRGPGKARVLRQIGVLNKAYDGGESADNTPTRFSFQLVSLDRTVNQAWHVASIGDRATRQARRSLHVGGPDELNLYVSDPSTGNRRGGGVVLGWSSMPWRAAAHLAQDGVTVNEGSLPGGRLTRYNRGDTAVHETGHWLGLFHTFQGGCSKRNDRVADTPAEAYPSTACDVGRDTCPAPGLDPVHNFMDYSYDTCMDMFTPGQVNRMTDNWLAYRTP